MTACAEAQGNSGSLSFPTIRGLADHHTLRTSNSRGRHNGGRAFRLRALNGADLGDSDVTIGVYEGYFLTKVFKRGLRILRDSSKLFRPVGQRWLNKSHIANQRPRLMAGENQSDVLPH